VPTCPAGGTGLSTSGFSILCQNAASSFQLTKLSYIYAHPHINPNPEVQNYVLVRGKNSSKIQTTGFSLLLSFLLFMPLFS
jgi:hypothetical protein